MMELEKQLASIQLEQGEGVDTRVESLANAVAALRDQMKLSQQDKSIHVRQRLEDLMQNRIFLDKICEWIRRQDSIDLDLDSLIAEEHERLKSAVDELVQGMGEEGREWKERMDKETDYGLMSQK